MIRKDCNIRDHERSIRTTCSFDVVNPFSVLLSCGGMQVKSETEHTPEKAQNSWHYSTLELQIFVQWSKKAGPHHGIPPHTTSTLPTPIAQSD